MTQRRTHAANDHTAHVADWRAWRHQHARQFLARLDPEADAFTFQTADDLRPAREEVARTLHGKFDRVCERLDGWNNAPVGIFVTVNETDGSGKRKAGNVRRVRAVFVDLDRAPLDAAINAGLEPHIVVESSPGKWHVYWLVDDCALDQFRPAQLALAQRFGGDTKVCDLPRVMRLPGFRHRKGAAHLARIVDGIGTTAPPYTLAEVVGKFGLHLDGKAAPEPGPDDPGTVRITTQQVTHLRDALNAIPADDYNVWTGVGAALRELGNAGRGLWLTWSAGCPEKFDQATAAAKWPQLKHDRTGYPAVFKRATEHYGWVNPASNEAQGRARGADASEGHAGTGGAPAGDTGGGAGTDNAPKDRAEQLRPLTVAEIRAQSGPRWLVREVIEQEVLAVIWGAPGSGKTFFTLDLACAVARGVSAMGKRVNRGGVIYIAAEGRLKPRLDAYCTQHGLADADLALLRGIPAAVNLSDASADILPLLAAMQRAAGEMGGVVLVVIDTLNAVMAGGDENSSEGMGGVLANARRIKEALGATVAIVHHGGKDEARGARGHSSLRGAIDSEIHIADAETHRTATVCKVRDGETGAVFAFKLHQVDLGPSVDPDAEEGECESSCVVEMLDGIPDAGPRPAKRDVALDALREAISEHGAPLPPSSTIPPGVRGVHLPQWLARWRLRTGDDYSTDRTRQSAFRREKAKLLAAGLVGISDPFVWLG